MYPRNGDDREPLPTFVEFDGIAARFYDKATRWLLEPEDPDLPTSTPDSERKKYQLAKRARNGIQIHFRTSSEGAVIDALKRASGNPADHQHSTKQSDSVNHGVSEEMFEKAMKLIDEPPEDRPWSFNEVDRPLGWIDGGGTTISVESFDHFAGYTMKRRGGGTPWFPVKSNLRLQPLFDELDQISEKIRVISRVLPLEGYKTSSAIKP